MFRDQGPAAFTEAAAGLFMTTTFLTGDFWPFKAQSAVVISCSGPLPSQEPLGASWSPSESLPQESGPFCLATSSIALERPWRSLRAIQTHQSIHFDDAARGLRGFAPHKNYT